MTPATTTIILQSTLTCPECGTDFEVVTKNPLELNPVEEYEEDEEEEDSDEEDEKDEY